MSAFDNVLGSLTGPRRMRSALRQKTAPITRLLVALDGPGELRATIPAAVFGGDIFGVMSRQLRDALLIPLNPPTPQLKHDRGRSIAAPGFATLNDPLNPFPLISGGLKRSPQWANFSHDAAVMATQLQSEPPAEQLLVSPFSPVETQIPRTGMAEILFAKNKPSMKPLLNPLDSAKTSSLPPIPTLVSGLDRYWQTLRDGRDPRHSTSRLLTESAANPVSFPVEHTQPQAAARAWPTSDGGDVSQKLRSFTEPHLPPKSRPGSATDRQIQNVFGIEVNVANHESTDLDDLGDRLAQILHEQALQHGIDVT